MLKRRSTTLYQYYKDKDFNPVYAGLDSSTALSSYERNRRKIFEYNLRLPVKSFSNASILEFGPASGENSLVYAKWGGYLHLIEPVEKFTEEAQNYFSLHNLTEHLLDVQCRTFESYSTQERFDFVIAEGFIFHVGSPDYWLPRLVSFGKEDCFVIFSHSETAGFLIELLQVKCLQVLMQNCNEDPHSLARKLYQSKWNRVNHFRRFDSWVNDNLVNPTVDDSLLNCFSDLQEIMLEHDMMLWSSWPSMMSYWDVSWIKKPEIKRDEVVRRNEINYFKLLPSLVIGKEIETNSKIVDLGGDLLKAIRSEITALAVPGQQLTNNQLNEVQHKHKEVGEYFNLCVHNYSETILAKFWQEIDECLVCLSNRDVNGITKIFNGKGPLAHCWGSPNFYSVWHRFN